jgi:phosphotransferase system enzyme I (PtsI)
MLAHASEIRQTLSLIDFARAELDNRGVAYGKVDVGAMIEIPAAALTLRTFLKYFDFLSIGTNDLIQYTLAIDRADESVAHLYDPCHPAVLRPGGRHHRRMPAPGQGRQRLRRNGRRRQFTRLLLGLGLRSFSMHPAQILAVKQEVLRADTGSSRPCRTPSTPALPQPTPRAAACKRLRFFAASVAINRNTPIPRREDLARCPEHHRASSSQDNTKDLI